MLPDVSTSLVHTAILLMTVLRQCGYAPMLIRGDGQIPPTDQPVPSVVFRSSVLTSANGPADDMCC